MKMFITICFIYFISLKSFAQIDPIDKNGLAIGGYDLVSYFESGQALKGNESIKARLHGATYHFINKENQKLFEANSEKFLPQYEGYCALAISYGKKISIDPQTFKVTDGKLYLFFHGNTGGRKINSIETWNKNEDRLLKKADQLWPDVKKKEYKSGSSL